MTDKATQSVIDAIDRRIIVATQSGLPLVSRPYEAIGEQLGLSSSEVMERLQKMQQAGVIRRIAAVPDHYKLGYKGNGMTVWDVPDERVTKLGQLVAQQDFVSHCYQRPRYLPEWPYNLFAMVHGKTKDDAHRHYEAIIGLLSEDCRQHQILFSTRILKKTGFRVRS